MRYTVDILRDLVGGKEKPWSIWTSKPKPWAFADDPEQAIRMVNTELSKTAEFRDLGDIEVSVTIHPDPRPLLRWGVERKAHGVGRKDCQRFTVDARTRREATEIVFVQAVNEFGSLASLSTGSVSLAVPDTFRAKDGSTHPSTTHWSWDIAGRGRVIQEDEAT